MTGCLKLLASAVGIMIASTTIALACSCMPPEPRTLAEIRASGGTVVLGRVLSAEKTGGADINAGNRVYRIRVEGALNLPNARSITLRSAPNGALCGVDLTVGRLEVLFIGGKPGDYRVGLCGNIFRPRSDDQARQWWRDFQSGGRLPPRR